MKKQTERDGVKEIEKVCIAVLKLQDSDFEEMGKVYTEQEKYTHPLKMATANRQHALGMHNRKVTQALKNLQDTIRAGVDI